MTTGHAAGAGGAATGRATTPTLDSDLADIQGGTTREGIHLGAMAGTVDMLLRCYTGLETRDGILLLHPTLLPELGHAEFQLTYRDHTIRVELTPDTAILQLRACAAAPIHVRVNDHEATLHYGQTYRFDLTDAEAHRRAGTAAAGARRPGADRPAPGTQR